MYEFYTKLLIDLENYAQECHSRLLALEGKSLGNNNHENQPRDNFGRWTAGGSSNNPKLAEALGYSKPQEQEKTQVAGGFKDDEVQMTVSEFITFRCLGSVHSEIPGEYYGVKIIDLIGQKSAAAKKCLKILKQDRFRQ